ncbi:hypothetical protein [Paenarthrobacter ilicis]|uniref:hypothetical protein n=1 Tax=Paenarthrobacter ilicis TaxID=43665 RepID=UPI003AB37B41
MGSDRAPRSTWTDIGFDTPNTIAIICNDLQHPISAESTAAEREAIAQIAIDHDIWALSDEEDFETRYEGVYSFIASLPAWPSEPRP